ncbi:MAG: endolytic transglycosylase MltG, partial [Pseudomonadota bacterium]
IGSERPHVATVFINRLRRGMRLQTDPTVIYGIWGGQGKPKDRGGLRRSELDRSTPYNTYQINGLPPTPIANPGRASMEAVANPLETDDLFFVADGTGGHAFAKTLDEHNANVRKWRRIEAERRREAEAAASEGETSSN